MFAGTSSIDPSGICTAASKGKQNTGNTAPLTNASNQISVILII